MNSVSNQRFVIALVAAIMLFGAQSRVQAENWPGWRKDGSGVSSEANVPTQWSTEQNIRWKTPIDGQGHSSPIVWEDQVIITTVRPTIDNHWLKAPVLISLTLLCGLVLWRLTDGTMRDPLGNDPTVWSGESRSTKLLRRGSAWILFVIIGYGTVVGVELAYDLLERYPEALRDRVIDKTWYFTDAPGYQDLDTPISPFRALTGQAVEGPFFGSPRIPRSCYLGGILAILAVLAVNSSIAARRRKQQGLAEDFASENKGDSAESLAMRPKQLLRLRLNLLGLDFRFGLRAEQPLRGVLRRLVEWVACLSTACFVVVVHSAAMADLPFVPSGTTWFLTVAIAIVGLIAFNFLLPSRPSFRILGAVITGLLLLFLFSQAPENQEFGLFVTARRAGVDSLVKVLLALLPVGLLAAWVAPVIPRRPDPTQSNRRGTLALAAGALLVCAGLYFSLANYLLPRSVYAREVVSLDRQTGDIQWTARCDASETVSELHAANTMATPTPVTDGEHVFVHFGDIGLFCIDLNGNLKWNYADPIPSSHWGAASSPIVVDDMLVMTYDADHQSMTIGIDKRSGDEKWRADRTSEIDPTQLYDAYSTPIVMERDGQTEVVHLACKLLEAYDPSTGQKRWSLSHPGEQPVATPVVDQDKIIILGGKYAPYLGAVRIQDKGGQPSPEVVWQASRNLSDMPSPVVYDGLFYMVTKDGIASCIDAESGEYKWRKRMPGAYWASLTAVDGKIYFCNANGLTTVLEAGPEYVELSENELDETVYASFAVSNQAIFIRTDEHVICIAGQSDG